MIHLQLEENEKVVLQQMLENCIADLHDEIAGTDNADYKTMLKGRKAVLIKLLESLQVADSVKAKA